VRFVSVEGFGPVMAEFGARLRAQLLGCKFDLVHENGPHGRIARCQADVGEDQKCPVHKVSPPMIADVVTRYDGRPASGLEGVTT